MIELNKFEGKPAILIATGPSLTEDVVKTIEKYKDNFVIIGCNDSYRIVDFLDIHYACDRRWWQHHGDAFRQKYPELESYTQCKESAEKYNLIPVEGTSARGLSIDPERIHWGANSGYQILNLALLFGCSKFILVGYNMTVWNNKRHFFGDHPQPINSTSPYTLFVSNYRGIQKELHPYIVNCTPHSALSMFKFNNLEDELCESSRSIR